LLCSSVTSPPPPATHTLSLHDALPIYTQAQLFGHGFLHLKPLVAQRRQRARRTGKLHHRYARAQLRQALRMAEFAGAAGTLASLDRKSTRLNSSHVAISYAVFSLKNKK